VNIFKEIQEKLVGASVQRGNCSVISFAGVDLYLSYLHLSNDCLFNIFIFEALKRILLSFMHNTCPYS
jgi:hypothetical protein